MSARAQPGASSQSPLSRRALGGTSGAPQPTAPLGSRSRGRLARAARAAAHGADRGRHDGDRDPARGAPGRRGAPHAALLAGWLALSVAVAGTLLVVTPTTRPPSVDEPPSAIQRLGPAEDDEPAAEVPAVLAARLVALAPAEDTATTADAPSTGLYVASGGPPLPLRAAPDRAAEVLVQVPDRAPVDDLGDLTPDGAWRHVAWNGWDGWIAAGLLLRRS